MIRSSLTILAWIALVVQHATAVPTWPSSVDELEDIMFLNSGYRSRGFAVAVTPCSFSAQGNGRIAAAEWIRAAFHDMATGSVFTGLGGLDASLVFETNDGENIGAAFNTTLTTFAPFLSSRASMADIIAMGVYTAVRSCGGPVVPIRTGRIDATAAGPEGVPLPQNPTGTFINQFARVGFNTSEMIAVTACGHTLGGVHAADFPEIVTPGTVANDFQHFDTTTVFDEKVASEYVSGTTANPLVVGPSVGNGRNSDGRVFAADGNVTIKAMANPATFASTCQTMLQKLIEVVPSGTVLTDPIVPYEVKPYAVQLTLLDGGATISFAGDIRVRTTVRPAGQIANVQLVYKDRSGGSSCGSCTVSTSYKGAAAGFDDSFAFYGFSAQLSANTSISTFNVLLTLTNGATELHNNNAAGFAVQDTIMLQTPQSCLNPAINANGQQNLTVVAAVRNPVPSSVSLSLILKTPRSNGIVVPALSTVSAAMASQSTVGSYTLYAATYAISASQSQTALFGVSAGNAADNYKNITTLPSTCASLSPTAPSSTPSSSAFTYQGCYTDSSAARAFTGAVYYDSALTVEKCSIDCNKFQFFGVEYGGECYCGNTQNPSSTLAGESDCNMACSGNSAELCGAANRMNVYKNLLYIQVINPNITGYTYQGCYNDSTASRALADSSTANDSMTVESCASFCNGATYFGVEYGRECYCGSALGSTNTFQPATDCSYTCGGNSSEYCGAGNRINIYKKVSASTNIISSSSSSGSSSSSSSSSSITSSIPVTSTTAATLTSSSSSPTSSSITSSSAPGPTLSGYAYQGCYTDSVSARVLTSKTESTGSMTWEVCASFCSGYNYFGVEYGSECYCGDNFTNPTTVAPASDCSFACSGNSSEVCGAGNRMNLFKSNTQHTGPSNPTIAGYTYAGCYTDSVEARVLNATYLFDNSMTVEECATFCAGYTYFGTEYGAQCYCGNVFANPTSAAAESDCSFLCPGNSNEFCGAGNRLTTYSKS